MHECNASPATSFVSSALLHCNRWCTRGLRIYMGRRWWDCVDFWSDRSVTQPPKSRWWWWWWWSYPSRRFSPRLLLSMPNQRLSSYSRRSISVYLSSSPCYPNGGDWTQPLRVTYAPVGVYVIGLWFVVVVPSQRRLFFSKFPIPFTIVQHSVSSFWRWWWSSFRHRHLRRRRRHLHTRTTRPRLSNHSSIHLSSIHSFVRRGDSNHICGGPTNTFCGVKH